MLILLHKDGNSTFFSCIYITCGSWSDCRSHCNNMTLIRIQYQWIEWHICRLVTLLVQISFMLAYPVSHQYIVTLCPVMNTPVYWLQLQLCKTNHITCRKLAFIDIVRKINESMERTTYQFKRNMSDKNGQKDTNDFASIQIIRNI